MYIRLPNFIIYKVTITQLTWTNILKPYRFSLSSVFYLTPNHWFIRTIKDWFSLITISIHSVTQTLKITPTSYKQLPHHVANNTRYQTNVYIVQHVLTKTITLSQQTWTQRQTLIFTSSKSLLSQLLLLKKSW